MTRWYKAVQGKAEGPLTSEEIREALETGKMRPLDLVFCEGDVSWRLVSEVPEFRETFSAPPTAASEEDFAWVVLRKKGAGYVQTGPLSAAQVRTRIGTGEIEYGHYAWRAGYKRWVRIGNIPEFDRRAKDRDGDPVNQIVPLPNLAEQTAGESTEELLSHVMRVNRPSAARAAEARPDEADGLDLVECRPITLPPLAGVGANEPQAEATSGAGLPTAEAAFAEAASAEAASAGLSDSGAPANGARVEELIASTTQKPPLRRGVRLAFAGAMSFLVIVVALYVLDHSRKGEESQATPVAELAPSIPTENRDLASVEGSAASLANGTAPANPSEAPQGALAQGAAAPPSAAQDPAFSAEATAEAWGQAAPGDDPNLAQTKSAGSLAATSGEETPKTETAPSAAAGAASAKTSGTVIELMPLKLETAPQLVVQTNAPVGEAITVVIKASPEAAAAGDGATKAVAFSRTVTLVRKPGEIPTIDLATWGLKNGAYEAEARVGGVETHQSFSIGHRVAEEKPKEERQSLAASARRLQDLSTSLRTSGLKLVRDAKGWTEFYTAWSKQASEAEKALESASAGAKAPGADELQLAVNHLLDQARQMNESFEQKRTVAGSQAETLAKLELEFKRLGEKFTREAK